MELLARYLYAFKNYLPKNQQGDIAEEMSDAVQSRVEEKEAQLGRPLTLDEESAILKSFGHPMVAASRYWPRQYLIGPVLFPVYVRVLKIALLVMLAANILIGSLLISDPNPWTAGVHIWGMIWGAALLVFGVVTLAFAIAERVQAKYEFNLDDLDWDPRNLPKSMDNVTVVSRLQSCIELVVNGIAALWLFDVPGVRSGVAHLVFGQGYTEMTSLPFKLGPWWQILLSVLLVAALANAALNVANLIKPEWTRLRFGELVVTNGLIAVACLLALRSQPLVAVGDGVRNAAQYAQTAEVLNWTAFSILLMFAIVCAVSVVVYVRRLVGRKNGTPAPGR